MIFVSAGRRYYTVPRPDSSLVWMLHVVFGFAPLLEPSSLNIPSAELLFIVRLSKEKSNAIRRVSNRNKKSNLPVR